MAITTVLFDLDGTLLPMDQDSFVKGYMKMLAAKMLPRGYDPKALIDGVWAGTAAMVKNDGSRTNEEAFWDTFASLLGERVRADVPLFEEFYRVEFQQAQALCGFDRRAAETVTEIRNMGLRAVLATNPLFPAVATESRIRWAGLRAEDFALYTTYETSRYCKPNPAYFGEIIDRLGISASECVMVGNDADEDMAAEQLGIPTFLLTDCLINRSGRDLSACPQGSYPELMEWLRGLVGRS